MKEESYGTNGARHYSPNVAYCLGIDGKYIYYGSHCVSKPYQYISEIIAHSGNKVSVACNRKEITREECNRRIKVIEVWEFSTPAEALAKEAEMVTMGKEILGKGCMNTMLGSNKKYSVPKEHRERMRKILKKAWENVEISPERRAFFAECGKKGALKNPSKLRSKAIRQYKDGALIAEYKSVMEASRATGLDDRGISKAAHGKYKICGGFEWKFVTQ